WVVITFAARDRANSIDHGNFVVRAREPRMRPDVGIRVDQRMLRAAIGFYAGDEFVFVFEPIEQLGLESVGGGERRAIDNCADRVGRQMAMARGLVHYLCEDIAGERFILLALSRRVVLLREDVGGVFVFAD